MEELDRYLVGIGICLFMLIPYACFRIEVFKGIRESGIRSRTIYKQMDGIFNYLWYLELAKHYRCRFASVLSILFTCLFPLVTLYHVCFGWWEVMPVLVDQIMICVLAALTAFITGFTVVNRNFRLFESPFVIFAAIRVRNQRGNFLNTAYYSVLLDFICMLAPPALAALMFVL